MNSSQIYRILSRDPVSERHFAGFFSSDKMLVIHRFPCVLVLNTDKHDEKGTHWLAVYMQDKKTL